MVDMNAPESRIVQNTGGIAFQENTEHSSDAIPRPSTTKRARWATTRVSGAKARQKRSNIITRLSRNKADEKRKEHDSSEPTENSGSNDGSDDTSEDADNGRRIFFNQPLPPDMQDEHGNPRIQYDRNKIRTARYTPLTFVPKNLYWQFHQIANVFFLFLIILGVNVVNMVCEYGMLTMFSSFQSSAQQTHI